MVLVSCNSVDDVLKPSDSISISILETLDTVRVVPGDTVSFKFMVFTNGGAIKNIDLETNDEIFEKHPEKMTFGLIDSIELTVDENGNLSRDVSSLIVEYPVYIKKNPAVVNNTLKAVFLELCPFQGTQLPDKKRQTHSRVSLFCSQAKPLL